MDRSTADPTAVTADLHLAPLRRPVKVTRTEEIVDFLQGAEGPDGWIEPPRLVLRLVRADGQQVDIGVFHGELAFLRVIVNETEALESVGDLSLGGAEIYWHGDIPSAAPTSALLNIMDALALVDRFLAGQEIGAEFRAFMLTDDIVRTSS